MAGVQDILGAIPIGQIASRLGVDEATARNAVQQAVPAIVGGLQKNVENGGGASLDRALDRHAAAADPTSVDDVDEEDGEKIVRNVFGDRKQEVAAALAGGGPGAGGQGSGGPDLGGIIGKVLPLVAPFVLAKLGNQKAAQQSGGGGFDLGGLLGGFLGGGASAGGAQQSGGGLDVGGILNGLGGLLGGGKK